MINDEELVRSIKNAPDPMQSKEMSSLVYRYTRTIRIKASRLRSPDIDSDDLQQEGYIALFDAVRSFDAEKGSFSAFAGRCIENRMKNAASKAKGRLEKAEDYDLGQVMDTNAFTDEYVIVKELYEKLSKLLTQKEYDVLKLYLEGYSYKQIAEKSSISLKSVDNSLSRTRKKLKGAL